MFCSDPYMTLLKSSGYNVVRLPRGDFSPLLLLADEGSKDLNRLGSIKDLLTGARAPAIKANTPAASISGKRTGTINIGIGLNLLGTIIGAMGGSQIGLDTQFKNTSSVVFEFPEVYADDVDVTKLDLYLGKAQINSASKTLARLLECDALYVVTGTVKAKKFSIDTGTDGSASAGVSVPVVQQIVGANVAVSGNATAARRLSFEGQSPLTFGFQARRLVYSGGNGIQLAAVEPGSVGAKEVRLKSQRGQAVEPPAMFGAGGFVRLS